MMKPYFKRKPHSTILMYPWTAIHPRVYELIHPRLEIQYNKEAVTMVIESSSNSYTTSDWENTLQHVWVIITTACTSLEMQDIVH